MLNPDTETKIANILKARHPQLVVSDLRFKLIVDDDRVIYRISAAGIRNHIFKTRGSHQKSETEFSDEYSSLKQFTEQARFKNKSINLPLPIALIDDSGILMTECPGSTLKEIYFRSLHNPLVRPSVTRAISNSASLLANIHSITLSLDSYPGFLKNRRDNLSRMLGSITRNLERQKSSQILTRVENLFAKVNQGQEKIQIRAAQRVQDGESPEKGIYKPQDLRHYTFKIGLLSLAPSDDCNGVPVTI